jgi:hypothetical protein
VLRKKSRRFLKLTVVNMNGYFGVEVTKFRKNSISRFTRGLRSALVRGSCGGEQGRWVGGGEGEGGAA